MGRALSPHKSWNYKDKILRQLLDMVSASWGELVLMRKKREAELKYGETEAESWGLHFSRWRAQDRSPTGAIVWFPEPKSSSMVSDSLSRNSIISTKFSLLHYSWPHLKPECFPIPVFLVLPQPSQASNLCICSFPWVSQSSEEVEHSC